MEFDLHVTRSELCCASMERLCAQANQSSNYIYIECACYHVEAQHHHVVVSIIVIHDDSFYEHAVDMALEHSYRIVVTQHDWPCNDSLE